MHLNVDLRRVETPSGEYSDHEALISSNSPVSDGDLESQLTPRSGSKGIKDLLKRLDLSFSNRRLSGSRRSFDGDRNKHRRSSSSSSPSRLDQAVNNCSSSNNINGNLNRSGSGNVGGDEEMLGDFAPPEWALLLIGCLLGLATGLCVAAFNRGVSCFSFFFFFIFLI